MLFVTLGARLLRNLLAGRGVGKERGLIRAREETLTLEVRSISWRRGKDF